MKPRIIISGILLIMCEATFGQYSAFPDLHCKQAYAQILSLKFAAAHKILNNETLQHPNNLYVDYLENYIDFLSVFISEDEQLLDSLDNNKNNRLDKIDELPDSNPYKKLMQANINLQWAFARLKFEEFFTAAIEINRAYRLITVNVKEYPDFIPNYIAMGVLHIMLGLIPDQYHWILNLVSMEGNVEKGKAELYRVLNESLNNKAYGYLNAEVLFYLGFVELNLSPDNKSIVSLLPYLQQSRNDNLMMFFLKVTIFMHIGQNDKALKMLNNTAYHNGYYPFYYLDYLKAVCYQRKLDTQADTTFVFFLKHFHGVNYIKDAWRKRAWDALITGDTIRYRHFMKEVLEKGSSIVDIDGQAQREAERNIIPLTDFIKAQLLFDGGYYRQALSTLNKVNTLGLNREQIAEYYYRYGRIYHRLQNFLQAKKYYKTAIIKGFASPRYFAANAALKLGEIFESEKNFAEAEKYYRQCLSMNFKEFRNSIRAKAKEGLQRIEK